MRISFVLITIFGANSGAENWGKTIDEWLICSNGKFQSPIDINTSHLLYDPNLDPFYIIPRKIHLITYNVDLYHNLSQALDSFHGVAIIAIFCKYGVPSNEAFQLMSKYTEIVRLKGQTTTISGIPLEILFPNTDQYVTYHGSLTTPGCSEYVTWIILNRPINVKQEHLDRFRHLSKGILGGPEAYLEHNVRPAMPSYDRLIKTNINFYQKRCYDNLK
ncbi:putative carbonic anhydrase-like protein 1 [Mytilus californianus]|uniref:putative carbonic anhydrase-like protein 1 n=1 Tax=Mytilus californianus TaxID=6549 RepID=UPI0022483760|nr:putative carbonic anhydrase-like protein 1 [Mytilus californianus]